MNLFALFVMVLGLRAGDRVADIGAGNGRLTFPIAEVVGPSGRVTATDVDPAALMRLIVGARGKNVEVRAVAPETPGLEAGAYDCVVMSQVDHLLDDRVAYLKAVKAALAPGGRIAVFNRAHHRAALETAAEAAGLRTTQKLVFRERFLVFLVPEDS